MMKKTLHTYVKKCLILLMVVFLFFVIFLFFDRESDDYQEPVRPHRKYVTERQRRYRPY